MCGNLHCRAKGGHNTSERGLVVICGTLFLRCIIVKCYPVPPSDALSDRVLGCKVVKVADDPDEPLHPKWQTSHEGEHREVERDEYDAL